MLQDNITMSILEIILLGLFVLSGRIIMDILFLGKMDSFYKSEKLKMIVYGFTESVFAVLVLSIIIGLMQTNIFFSIIYGLGAVLGMRISSFIKRRLDDKLEGQRKFFVRITIDERYDYDEVIHLLKEDNFDFSVVEKNYISGHNRIVIEGSVDNRDRLNRIKDILRGRKGKHVVILRAEDIYLLH